MIKIFSPEKLLAKPDCILFDTDNTLYPYEPAHQAAINAVCEKITQRFNISSEVFNQAFNEAKSLVKKQLKKMQKETNAIFEAAQDELKKDVVLNEKIQSHFVNASKLAPRATIKLIDNIEIVFPNLKFAKIEDVAHLIKMPV